MDEQNATDGLMQVQLIGAGEYDLSNADGSHPRFLDIYTATKNVRRLSVHKECALPSDLTMGDVLTIGFLLGETEKIVRGEERDRAVKGARLVARDVARVLARNGSKASAPAAVAA